MKGIKSMNKTLKIEGMMCMHCAGHVKEALLKVKGVESAEVSLEKKEAVVSLKAGVEDKDLIQAVNDAGYEVKEVC